MLLYKNRMGVILCFAGAGVLMAALQFGLRLKNSDVAPPQKYVLPERPAPLHLEGGYLQAFIIAYTDLVLDTNIPPTYKEITNYSVDIIQDPLYYKIKFTTKPLPEDISKDGIEAEIVYWISKATGRLTRK